MNCEKMTDQEIKVAIAKAVIRQTEASCGEDEYEALCYRIDDLENVLARRREDERDYASIRQWEQDQEYKPLPYPWWNFQ